jgi:hypothetical protein
MHTPAGVFARGPALRAVSGGGGGSAGSQRHAPGCCLPGALPGKRCAQRVGPVRGCRCRHQPARLVGPASRRAVLVPAAVQHWPWHGLHHHGRWRRPGRQPHERRCQRHRAQQPHHAGAGSARPQPVHGCAAGACVVCGGRVCGVLRARVWCAAGACVVCCGRVCGVLRARVWCAAGVCVVCGGRVCGVRRARVWCAAGACVVCGGRMHACSVLLAADSAWDLVCTAAPCVALPACVS